MMKLGYSILYVADVPATVAFYEHAFGLKRRFLHESNSYAEMETGETALAFAAEELADAHGFSIRPNRPGEAPSGFEIALVNDDPRAAYRRAVEAGATPLSEPVEKPWGQIVGYVRDLNGCLVEICSAVST